MNLDEMAEKQEAQEAEEEEEETFDEVIHHEDIPGEIVYHDHYDGNLDATHQQSNYQLTDENISRFVSVTDETPDDEETSPSMANPSDFNLQFGSKYVCRTPQRTKEDDKLKNSRRKSEKGTKKKKKQKVLDFFGTGAYNDHDENEQREQPLASSTKYNSASSSNTHTAVNNFDNDAGFALGNLFDVEMPPHEEPTVTGADRIESQSTTSRDDISAYLTTFFAGSQLDGNSNSSSDNRGQGVMGSVLSMSLPTSFSFFDTIDEEINLEEDPILQQVERNRSLGVDQTPNKPSYISYLESVLPPPARLFGFDNNSDSQSSETVEERMRKQQQQQQVDRILGLTNARKTKVSVGVQSCMGYARNCLFQSRTILITDLFSTIGNHLSVCVISFRESGLPLLLEQLQRFGVNFKGIFIPSSDRLTHLYHFLSSIGMLIFTCLKLIWIIVYAILRIAVSVLWHIIQVLFLTSLYIVQCVRSPASTSASPSLSAEERLQQWRTRWRSFAEDYLSSNNALSKNLRLFHFFLFVLFSSILLYFSGGYRDSFRVFILSISTIWNGFRRLAS